MSGSIYRVYAAVAVAIFCLGFSVSPALAAESPPELDPLLSLTGNCATSAADPIPDPGCPDPPHPGRFNEPRSVAIDAYGNEYVANFANGGEKGRIDVFDSEGAYLTTLADPAGPQSLAVDTKGNLYVYERNTGKIVRYPPSVYEPEAENISYGNPSVPVDEAEITGNGLAIDFSDDHLFVTQGNAINEYGSAAEENKLLNIISDKKLGSWSTWVAVDAQRRRLYASACQNEVLDCGVLVFEADAPYGLLEEVYGPGPEESFVSTKGWLSVAVDEESGHFFIDDLELSKSVYEFDEDYEFVSKLTRSDFQGGQAMQIAVSSSPLNEQAANRGYLFVPVVLQSGRVFAFEPPGVAEPEILAAGTGSIGESEAQLQAMIDPRGADTKYVFEYVTQAAFKAEGFIKATVAGEGTISGVNLATKVQVFVAGLAPGGSYRFRVRAENEAGEADPVGEASFTTYFDSPASESCPNEGLRIGPSGRLPDCRAFELVTPPDTNGHPPEGVGFTGDRFPTLSASPGGNIVSFLLEGGALPGDEGTGGFNGDPYRATRGPSGWGSAAAGPSGAETIAVRPGGVSPDQGYSFWEAIEKGSAVIEGNETRYVRYPDGHSELVGRGSLGTDSRARGMLITENGSHIIFQTQNFGSATAQQLEPEAPPTGTTAVYDRTADEVTHVVSLLPGDVTPVAKEDALYLNASADGAGIAFEIKDTLYLRKDNAVTYEIGTGVTFAGVSEGGERIFYVEGGDLLAFDTETEAVVLFSETGDVTPVNVAPGGARAYFVSPSVLGEENPNGALAQAGKENLYLSEEGAISFVGTVTTEDVDGEVKTANIINGLGFWVRALKERQPGLDPSRLTPGGSVLVFQSRASLTDQETGGTPQIYRYDRVANRLHCLSCIPTGVPEGGGANLQSFAMIFENDPPLGFSGFVPNLRADGERAFFESEEALVSGDTDGVRDVYEWEEDGVGGCQRTGGCVYLVTSGHSTRDNFLYAHSASGDDVFFTTGDLLTGSDAGGTSSIYDARVNGGFAESQSASCEGEGCRPSVSPQPAMIPPAKPSEHVDDNFPRRCPKGKRQVKRNGKVRCVKKHRKHKSNKKAGTKKGAGR